METPACAGCRERDAGNSRPEARVAALEEEVRQLKGLLGRNASNSSVPPSANPQGERIVVCSNLHMTIVFDKGGTYDSSEVALTEPKEERDDHQPTRYLPAFPQPA